MYKLFALATIVAVFSVSSAFTQEYRNFIGSNGKVIEAAFLGFDEATQIVKIRLKDGREQNVKLDLFSAESQQWVKAGGKDSDNPFGDADTPSGDVGKAGDRKVLTIKDVEYAFRWCPPGTFMMGSPASEKAPPRIETQHQVTLTRGFWMLETEVTQKMWENVKGNNPSRFKGNNFPVENVSWNDSQEFIQKLNDLDIAPAGFKFSLPTEAQWEYACRAGTTTAHHFGNTLARDQANFGGHTGGTTDVASYPANAWGLHDMHGNVWEWCLDWFGEYPSGTVTDPTGASSGSYRVYRGGYWSSGSLNCRSASRGGHETDNLFRIGLRLALVRAK